MTEAFELKKRNQVFGLKMSQEEIKILKERANKVGMSAGAYLRFLFHQEINSKRMEGEMEER